MTMLTTLAVAVFLVSPSDVRVIDGDTWDIAWPVGVVRYRFPDVDAAEIRNANCPEEARRGQAAKRRLIELVGSGRVALRLTGEDCALRRPCADLLINGVSAIATMTEEHHLRSWHHEGRKATEPRPDWCGG